MQENDVLTEIDLNPGMTRDEIKSRMHIKGLYKIGSSKILGDHVAQLKKTGIIEEDERGRLRVKGWFGRGPR